MSIFCWRACARVSAPRITIKLVFLCSWAVARLFIKILTQDVYFLLAGMRNGERTKNYDKASFLYVLGLWQDFSSRYKHRMSIFFWRACATVSAPRIMIKLVFFMFLGWRKTFHQDINKGCLFSVGGHAQR